MHQVAADVTPIVVKGPGQGLVDEKEIAANVIEGRTQGHRCIIIVRDTIVDLVLSRRLVSTRK